MAITSVGYDGTISEAQWANLSTVLGADYGVIGHTSFRTTAVVGQDRTVAISTGTGFGWGVRDTSDAQVTLQLGTISTGTRWDLIALRRNWQPTGGTSSFVVVPGTTAAAIPAARLLNPGVQADQPIALVQVTAGQTTPTGIMDLRCFASKVLAVETTIALPDASYGTDAIVSNADRWRRVTDSGGNLVWTRVDDLKYESDVKWAWGGETSYAWTLPNSTALSAAPGSVRLLPVRAGHSYLFSSQWNAHATVLNSAGAYVGALMAPPGSLLKRTRGFVAAGSTESTVTMVDSFRATATGTVEVGTYFRGAISGIELTAGGVSSPSSMFVDLGLRP